MYNQLPFTAAAKNMRFLMDAGTPVSPQGTVITPSC